MLELRPAGLYCPAGDFYIDPWWPVARAVITHGHGDHAREGSAAYLCATPGAGILRARLGESISLQTVAYGASTRMGAASVTLHPAGHILGSAQIRIETGGYVWVVSGDYKLEPDPTCEPFEPVRCHGFITEATFALPIYRWVDDSIIFGQINTWWRDNREKGRASVLYGYSLGKAQRLLAGVDASIGPIYTHGSVERINGIYRAAGVTLPQTSSALEPKDFAGALIVAPPSVNGTGYVRRFGESSTAMASGWMQVRGHRRRRAIDRGFVLSDHADWPGLLRAVHETGAETIWVTHGYTRPLAQWLREHGKTAEALETQFEPDEDSRAEDTA